MRIGVHTPLTQKRLTVYMTDHDTRHAVGQRHSGIGAAETEESVTLGKTRKRKDRTVSGASHQQLHLGRNASESQAI